VKLEGSEKFLGGSGVCKDKTKKKSKTQKQHASKASNNCMQVQNHPIMPRRNLNPNKSKAHAFRDIPPSYVLRRNNVGKVVATYVGNESNIYVKRSLWVSKVLVANVEGPSQIGDLKEGTKLFCRHTAPVDQVGCLIADVHII
jgi:hypothetical protein